MATAVRLRVKICVQFIVHFVMWSVKLFYLHNLLDICVWIWTSICKYPVFRLLCTTHYETNFHQTKWIKILQFLWVHDWFDLKHHWLKSLSSPKPWLCSSRHTLLYLFLNLFQILNDSEQKLKKSHFYDMSLNCSPDLEQLGKPIKSGSFPCRYFLY